MGLILPKLCLGKPGYLTPNPLDPPGRGKPRCLRRRIGTLSLDLGTLVLGKSMPIDRGYFLRFTLVFLPEGGLINFSFDSQVFWMNYIILVDGDRCSFFGRNWVNSCIESFSRAQLWFKDVLSKGMQVFIS